MKMRLCQGWIVVLLFVCGCGSDDVDESTREALEQSFQESMSGVSLEGFFKTNEPDAELRREQYTIAGVTKLAGNLWMFRARIQYGERDVTLPVPVTIRWAGDTPILMLTEATIPGLGTFTARVLFYDGQYVGIWRHGEHTGQHFGRIIPENSAESFQ